MKRKNNCYYFAPDAGAPCRDGSRRSPSTSTPKSSPQMLQVVRRAAPAPPSPADVRRRQRGSCWGGGNFSTLVFHPHPRSYRLLAGFLGRLHLWSCSAGLGGLGVSLGGVGLGLPCSAARGGPPMSSPSPIRPHGGTPVPRNSRGSPRGVRARGAPQTAWGGKDFFFFFFLGRVRGERGRNCEPSSQG